MNNLDFAHLHVHSVYSQLDGMGQHKDYITRAKELGFKYLACTDHGNIDGLIRFQKACKEQNIKPILGCEGYIVKEWEKKSPRGHICLWIKTLKGFKNLCKILTLANLEGFYYKPRINFETLLKYHEGLVIGTACVLSFTKTCKDGLKFFQDLHDIKRNDLYCEIMPHNSKEQIKHNQFITKLANENKIKIIASNDCHYVNRKDWKAHEVLLAIQTKSKWDNPNRWKFDLKGYHLRSIDEMKTELEKIGFYKKEYFTNTIEIAEKCSDFTIPKQDIELPNVPWIGEENENKTLWDLCTKGYKDKFHHSINHNLTYYDRLKFEYDVIKEKNFTRYFLIVWELCNWCRKNEIPVGPRGSVAGSLMAMLLGITSIDPIKHHLIFDRFINKDRIDYPDIDMDFPDNKRYLIKEHLEELYSADNVAGVSSFNRMKARAAIQDVSRVFKIPNFEVNKFTKMIDEKVEDENGAIHYAIENYPECKEFSNKYPKIIKYARALENNIKSYSQHAAGLIVSKQNIGKSGRCNLLVRDKIKLINWEKDDAEHVGLMKLDALGLKQLTIISEAVKLIKKNHNKTIKLESLDLEDKDVLNDINNGNTIGIFQFNTWTMTKLVTDMGIEEFSHLSDAVALVRPGPANSGMTEEYIKRKHKGKWKHKNKVYEQITKDTYGIIAYQEQIMQVINQVAGLPYSTADSIRKIIGKKRDVSEFKQYQKKFMNGCRKQKLFSQQEAKEFWIALQEHARYSFNKSHSVCYAVVGYWTAWLKHYFPNEFICSSLTYGAKQKKSELIEEAYRIGLTLKLPKVGISDSAIWLAKDKDLYVPFKEIKGFGDIKAAKAASFPNIQSKKSRGISSFYTSVAKENINQKHKGAIGRVLESINAYDKNSTMITDEICALFDFRIIANPRENYQNLYNLFDGHIRIENLDPALNGDSRILKKLQHKKLIKKVSFEGFENLNQCSKCNLIHECNRPVAPSPGRYNIAIIGEAPGSQENKHGMGFYGNAPAGKLLWKKINKAGYTRDLFHISNVGKCYPSKSHKPNSKQIEICGSQYLDAELKEIKPKVILAFGNTNRQFFEGVNQGIISISGKTTWSEKYACWICWCIHPAAVLHNPENSIYFKEGMKNFFKILKTLAPNLSSKI